MCALPNFSAFVSYYHMKFMLLLAYLIHYIVDLHKCMYDVLVQYVCVCVSVYNPYVCVCACSTLIEFVCVYVCLTVILD